MLFGVIALTLHFFVSFWWQLDRNTFNLESVALNAIVSLGYGWYSTYGMYQLVKLVKGENEDVAPSK